MSPKRPEILRGFDGSDRICHDAKPSPIIWTVYMPDAHDRFLGAKRRHRRQRRQRRHGALCNNPGQVRNRLAHRCLPSCRLHLGRFSTSLRRRQYDASIPLLTVDDGERLPPPCPSFDNHRLRQVARLVRLPHTRCARMCTRRPTFSRRLLLRARPLLAWPPCQSS